MQEQKESISMGLSREDNYGNGKHIESPPTFAPSRVNIDDIVSGSNRMDPDMILKKLNDT